VFLIAGGNSGEGLEFTEEPLDEIAVAIEEPARGGHALAPRERLHIGIGPAPVARHLPPLRRS